MRKLIIAAAALLLAAGPASAEDIGGLWLSAEGREGGCAIVEFVQEGKVYNGKVIAILENERATKRKSTRGCCRRRKR